MSLISAKLSRAISELEKEFEFNEKLKKIPTEDLGKWRYCFRVPYVKGNGKRIETQFKKFVENYEIIENAIDKK